MSSEPPPEFFFDRSLGKETARELASALGWVVHLVAEEYANDGQDVADEQWIRAGCGAGWVLLSKDKRIRYRGSELAELHRGQLFCLSSGNLVIAEMVRRFTLASTAIVREATAATG